MPAQHEVRSRDSAAIYCVWTKVRSSCPPKAARGSFRCLRASASPSRDGTIACRVSGASFQDFLEQLPALSVPNAKGHTMTQFDVIDHELSWSVYFVDPDGNRIEVTTYDYAQIAAAL